MEVEIVATRIVGRIRLRCPFVSHYQAMNTGNMNQLNFLTVSIKREIR